MSAKINGETKNNVNKMIVNKFMKMPVLTTTERDKLKTEKGLLVYNSTTDKLQVFTNVWIDLH